ncbi:MAG: ATP-binding protein [Nanoarchaeota archaeon]
MKESETLELKKSTSELKEGIISIAAILNKHQEGELYFGVRNDGTIIGQEISERTIREVSKAISDHIEPKVFPTIHEVENKVIKVEFTGNNSPYYAYGRAYIRVGDEDKQLSAKELENLILRKNKEKLRWDNRVCEKAKLSDINEERVKWFVEKGGLKYDSVKSSLEKLGLIR